MKEFKELENEWMVICWSSLESDVFADREIIKESDKMIKQGKRWIYRSLNINNVIYVANITLRRGGIWNWCLLLTPRHEPLQDRLHTAYVHYTNSLLVVSGKTGIANIFSWDMKKIHEIGQTKHCYVS